MKKMLQRGIAVLLGMIMGGFMLFGEAAYAEVADNEGYSDEAGMTDEAGSAKQVMKTENSNKNEGKEERAEAGVLTVRITRDDGIEITPKDKEVINVHSGIRFSGNMEIREDYYVHKRGTDISYEDEDGLLREKTELQYALSYDGGETFGEWQSLNGDSLYMAPGSYQDGDYCLKLRKLQEYVINENKAESLRIAERISLSCTSREEASDNTSEEPDNTEAGEEETDDTETREKEPDNTEAGEEEQDDKEAVEEDKTDVPGDPGKKDIMPDEMKTDESKTVGSGAEESKTEESKSFEAREETSEEETGNNGSINEISADPEYVTAEERIRRAEELAATEGIHVIESAKYYVNLDTAAPALLLDTDAEEGEWTNRGVKCAVKINDTGSGPAWIRITYDDNRITEESFSRDTGMSGTQKEFFINSESSSESGGELVIEAEDRAGNRARLCRRIGIDRSAPEISVKGPEEGRIYSKPVTVSIVGEDDFPDTVCVGYTVKRIVCGTEENAASSARTLSECNSGILYTADTDGDYIIECHARDRAGNVSRTIKRCFRIDTTPPGLKLEGVSDKACLSSDAAIRITACDNYEDGYNVSLKGTLKSGEGSRELKLADYKTEGLISSNTYYFKTDGDYELSVEVKDGAGNISRDEIAFSIDRTAPEISLLDGLSTSEKLVTNEPPVIRFRVYENNYRKSLVSYELKKAGSKEGDKDLRTSEWFMSNTTDEYSVQVEEEGSYELLINAVDGAGNMSSKTIVFTLDMTSPRIDYVENLNKKYVKCFKLPDNFNEYIKDQGEVSYRTYINSRNYDETEQIEEDGKYVLKVSAVDDAGNQTEKTVEFIVDGTLPRVVIDGMSDDGSVNKDGVITLSLYDEGDYFRSVKLNGEEMVTGEGQTTVEIPIADYGDYRIEVEAADMADNILTQTIEAKCANASPVEKGVSTVRTLKRSEKSGSNKGLRIFLIVMTVVVLGVSIVVFTLYSMKTSGN